MSATTLASPAALEDSEVFDALAALRTSGDALGDLLDDVFEDLDLLSNEVELGARLLEESRRQAAEQAAELQQLRQAETLARSELAAVRREIDEAGQQLVALPQLNNELRDRLHSLELERCSLESELEALRVRTAELADHLAEVKREAADERAEWSGELKQLRRTLERQAELLSDRLETAQAMDRAPAALAPAPSTPGTPPVAAPVAAKDAVLGSVMAQFESLQRDRQRRRNT